MKRAITLIVILLSAFVFLPLEALGQEDNVTESSLKEETFTGTRTLICRFDRSDLNNFIDGGYNSFSKIISEANSGRYNLQTEKDNRDLIVTVSFSFDNLDEYKVVMRELLGYNPVVVYQTGENFIFAENFNSGEMLNFIQKELMSNHLLKELTFDSLLTVEQCTLTLNGQTYETTENFDIRDGNNIKFDELNIETTYNQDGGAERIITARINKENMTDDTNTTVINNFKMAGNIEENTSSKNLINATLHITGENQYELAEKTLIATGLTISTIETESPGSDYILVDCVEQLGIKKILNDNGKYKYTCTYPAYYMNILIEPNEDLSIEGNKISYSGKEGKFEYSYQRGLKLSSLKIITDISKLMGNIKRTIKIGIPYDSSDVFGGKVTQVLENVNNEFKTANISTDNEGMDIIYEIEFSSHDAAQISEFTKALLKGNDVFEYNRNILPFQKNNIIESISAGEIINNMIPVSEMELTYKTVDKTQLISSQNTDYTFYNNAYTEIAGKDANISIEYFVLNKIVIAIISAIALLCIIAIIIIVFKIRGYLKSKKPGNSNKNNE